MARPRQASLKVAHAADCPQANRNALDSLRGCTCKPSYFTFHRDRNGRVVKGPRVKDRQVAERSLRKVQVEIDEGRTGQTRPADVTFDAWAATYLGILEQNGRRASTLDAYGPTIRYCSPIFGTTPLSAIGNPELRAIVAKIRENGGTDGTVGKHLRHLSALLTAAVDDGLIPANPVPKFKKTLRLRVGAGVEPYTDVELAKLWVALAAAKAPDVYVTAAKLALTTGARAGELAALSLDDVDLLHGRLEIRHHYDRVSRTLTLPKDSEPRTIHLIASARAILESWIAGHGDREGAAPLLPGPSGGRLDVRAMAEIIRAAMRRAGIPELGEGGRPRKPIHSLRASFTRLMLEQGRHPQWVQSELGHASPDLTLNVYGAWTEAARTAEADLVDPEGFPV